PPYNALVHQSKLLIVTKHSGGGGNRRLAVATSPFGPLPAVWLNAPGECPDVHLMRPRLPALLLLAPVLAASPVVGTAASTVTPSKPLPPALDLEDDGGLCRNALITWAQNFLLDVRNLTGRTPMIYTYPWFWQVALGDAPALNRYPLWMAAYHGSTPDAGATLWQYTAGAKVSGIHGPVDMSRLLADPATFDALAD